MPRTAFIVEKEGPPSEGSWLTGRFEGHVEGERRILDRFEDLPLDEALAWGRDRAERVLIRHGDALDVHYSAGDEHPPGVPRWPPDDLPVLGRRRIPEERWLDRTDADPPIAWRVDVHLIPPDAHDGTLDDLIGRRAELETAAAGIAQSAGAAAWDIAPLDRFIADLRAARRRARGAEELGWHSTGEVALHLVFELDASTAALACAAATARMELPPGWRAEPAAAPLA